MSQADNLLNSLSNDISLYTATPETEPHIVVDNNRFITVPDELKRIAVQHDHDVETVTFDCPRYWDGIDLSTMKVYINYMRANMTVGKYLCQNVVVDETDSTIMHFDWTISGNVTFVEGSLSFLVCIKTTDIEGNEKHHWNSELNTEMYISTGLEVDDAIINANPDIITQLLVRMDEVEKYSSQIAEMMKADENFAKQIAELLDSDEDLLVQIQKAEKALGTETTERKTADEALLGQIQSANKALESEITNRETADNALLAQIQNANKALEAEIGNRKAADEELLNQMKDIAEGATVIPDYWQTHLDERIPAIRSAMASAGWNKSAFLWYNDVHWTYGFKRAPMLLKYMYDHTPINKTIFGGDIIDNEGDDTTTMAYLWDWREAIRDIPNHHSVPGNHDDGNSIDNRFDDAYIYAFLLAAEETPDIVRGDALYYYIDDPTEKTRYLYLDTATKDGNIINDTTHQAWLKETLKSTPDGWHIVAIGHIWRTVDYDVTPPADAGFSWGGKFCLDEFDAYNARSGEYADCTGKVEFCIGGHTHVDADFYSDGGILVMLTECDSKYVRSGLTYTEGTITEASVNAIVADYISGVVNVIRVGRGESRVVPLVQGGDTGGGDEEEEIPDVPTGDFTNVLGTVGYSEGIRYSDSAQAEVEAEGWDLTGYIPAKRGDVIRMVNVDFMDIEGTGTDVSRAQVYLFDADKNFLVCSANYSPDSLMSAAWSAVYGDNGDVIQFTIPTSYSSSTAYIRIGAKDITQYSVITVNEAIE